MKSDEGAGRTHRRVGRNSDLDDLGRKTRKIQTCSTAGIIQLTKEFEFPAKTVLANNLINIDLWLRF